MLDIKTIIFRVNEHIINPLIFLLLLLAFLSFFWGLFNFISNADNEEGRSTGKKHMVYGIVGIVIMVSAYTILSIVTKSFNLQMPLQVIS